MRLLPIDAIPAVDCSDVSYSASVPLFPETHSSDQSAPLTDEEAQVRRERSEWVVHLPEYQAGLALIYLLVSNACYALHFNLTRASVTLLAGPAVDSALLSRQTCSLPDQATFI